MSLIGIGGFLVSVVSYTMGIIGLFTNFDSAGAALSQFLGSFFLR